MAKIVRKSVESTVENQIAIASIVSTDFLGKIEPIINYDFFINPYVKTICKWCLDYYKKFGKAPVKAIQDIYDVEQHSLDKAEAELISSVLAKLSTDYVEGEGVNDDYIFDNTLKLFDERDLSLRLDKAIKLKEIGKIKEAKDLITIPSKVERIVTEWIQLDDPKLIEDVFDMNKRELLKFPGVLGEMWGAFERDWLVAILGSFKRGKSLLMMEFAMRALLNHLNVAFISLEMSKVSLAERFYKRISGLGDEEEYFFPVFDCVHKQMDTCDKTKFPRLKIKTTKKDVATYNPDYVPCSECRGTKAYKPDIWYEKVVSPSFTLHTVKKKLKGFETMYGNNLQIKVYPRFSASVDDIRRDLDFLERSKGFIPDLIIADYADILKPGKGMHKEGHQAFDDIWMNLAALPAERHCLVITGSQGNRGSLKKETHEEEDLAEWIGKLGHVDMFLAINQMAEEKRRGFFRANTLVHRHRKFIPDEDVIILQHLDTMQMILDSEISR